MRKKQPARRRLTPKQKTFIAEYVKTKNATQAAMQAYDVKDKTVAKSMGSENLSKPYILDAVNIAFESLGIDENKIIKSVYNNLKRGEGIKATASDSLRAAEILLKLKGYINKPKQELTIHYSNMDKHQLLKEKQKLDNFFNKILK